MARKRKPPRLWKVLNYELQMYYGSTLVQKLDLKLAKTGDLAKALGVFQIKARLTEQLLGVIQAVITSGQTETKALHIRVLTEMFLARKRENDLNIDDLIPSWRAKHPDLIKVLYKAYTDKLSIGNSPKGYIDTHMAHATKMRDDHFNWKPVINRMDPPIKAILATLAMRMGRRIRWRTSRIVCAIWTPPWRMSISPANSWRPIRRNRKSVRRENRRGNKAKRLLEWPNARIFRRAHRGNPSSATHARCASATTSGYPAPRQLTRTARWSVWVMPPRRRVISCKRSSGC